MRVRLGHAWHEPPRNVCPAARPIARSLSPPASEGRRLPTRRAQPGPPRPAEHAQCAVQDAPPKLRSGFSAASGGGVDRGCGDPGLGGATAGRREPRNPSVLWVCRLRTEDTPFQRSLGLWRACPAVAGCSFSPAGAPKGRTPVPEPTLLRGSLDRNHPGHFQAGEGNRAACLSCGYTERGP